MSDQIAIAVTGAAAVAAELTECKPCRWLLARYNWNVDAYKYICHLTGKDDPKPCERFEREPGSDDE